MKGQNLFFRVARMLLLLLGSFLALQLSAYAALSVDIITWDMIGLDSNDVDAGPNHFPVGARICNEGVAPTNAIIVTLNLGAGDAGNIYARPESLTSVSVPALGPGTCSGITSDVYFDAYFEIEILRDAASYFTSRQYTISADDGGGNSGTSETRELYVEKIISQNRNVVRDISYGTDPSSLTSVSAGGTLTMMVGGTYYILVEGQTATNGYEQLEMFIGMPNTVFQVNSVLTQYTADSSGPVPGPLNNMLYGDACTWDATPPPL